MSKFLQGFMPTVISCSSSSLLSADFLYFLLVLSVHSSHLILPLSNGPGPSNVPSNTKLAQLDCEAVIL